MIRHCLFEKVRGRSMIPASIRVLVWVKDKKAAGKMPAHPETPGNSSLVGLKDAEIAWCKITPVDPPDIQPGHLWRFAGHSEAHFRGNGNVGRFRKLDC
jgi:hypothetical protein